MKISPSRCSGIVTLAGALLLVSAPGNAADRPLPSPDPAPSEQAVDVIDPMVAAYAQTTGIGENSARKINRLLHSLRDISGTEPAFLWLGGSDYNRAAQDVAVIGGTAAILTNSGPAPAADGPNSCRFNLGHILQFANPAAMRSPDVQEWVLAIWYEAMYTDGASAEVVSTYEDNHRGFRMVLNKGAEARVYFYQSATDDRVESTTRVIHPSEPAIRGMNLAVFHLKKDGDGLRQRILRGFDDQDYYDRYISSFWNDGDKLFLGGHGGSGSNPDAHPHRFADVRLCGVALIPSMPVSPAARRELGDALWTSGIREPERFPAMLCVGDSTMNNRWNDVLCRHDGAPHGGQWTGAVHLDQVAKGGSSLAWLVAKTALIRERLKTKAWTPKYLVLGVEAPGGAPRQNWEAIGVPEGDADGWYRWIENWVRETEQETEARIILCSYIRGNNDHPANYMEADRDKVGDMCRRNGWQFVDLWADPHSKVWTGSVPGDYGFYQDAIHPDIPGTYILAERFAACIAHPTSEAPRADTDAPPAIGGKEDVGATLTCSTGTWHNTPEQTTYQWLRNLAPIEGATASTYVLQASDAGARIACRVTAVKPGHNTASFTAAPTGVISDGSPGRPNE